MVGQVYIGLTTLLTSLSLTSSGTWIYLLMPDSAFSLQGGALSSLILNTSQHFQTPCTEISVMATALPLPGAQQRFWFQ